MRLVHFHPGPDTAGQSMAGKRFLEEVGDEVQVFVHSPHAFGYDQGETWDPDEVRAAYRWADVVVIHNDPTLIDKVSDGSSRELVLHHHGSRFRNDPVRRWQEAEAIGARQIVSTVDLLLSVPPGGHADWLPQVVDLELMQEIRDAYRRDEGRIRVVHAPTNRRIKGTRFVQRAMRLLKTEAEFVLVQRQRWMTCLAMKATADIFVDQLNLGYGNNAIEAWAMGLPVLAAAPPEIILRMRREFRGPVPFYNADPMRFVMDLRKFINSPELRTRYAERGRKHVDRYHAPDAWVRRARQIYMGDMVEAVA